ncbi:MAG: hypothetical protein RL094_49 [Candidatus Parcubacteria bacterium]|jgi:hypothetical protein
MQTLADLLKKFKEMRDPAEDKGIIQNLIKEVSGATVPVADITLRNNKIILNTHPALRSVVYTRKKEILEKIQSHEELKNRQFTDIV